METATDPTLLSTISPELALTEAQIVALSIDELERYVSTLTAASAVEESTIKGYDNEITSINNTIDEKNSTIDGYTTNINSYTLLLGSYNSTRESLITQSTALDYQIRTSTMQLLSTNNAIARLDSTLKGLSTTQRALQTTYDNNISSYISSAQGYSTLYYAYLAADDVYTSTQKGLSTMSSQLISTNSISSLLERNYINANNIYLSSLAALDALNKELSSLTIERNALNASFDLSTLQYNDAVASTTVLSSLYETSLLNQEYISLVSSQTAAIEMNTSSITAQASMKKEYNANPTNANKAAFDLATQFVKKTGEERSTITGKVNSLASILKKAVDTTYQMQLDTIESAILTAYNDQSTFKRYKEIAYENLRNASSLMETARRNMQSTIDASTLYTSYYNSTLKGIDNLQTTLDAQITAIQKDETDQATLSKRVKELQTIVETQTEEMNTNILLSSLYTATYKKAMENYKTYDDYYNSTMAGIAANNSILATQDAQIVSTNVAVVVQSSIERKADINVRKYGGDVLDGTNQMNEGVDRYNQTFLREQRVAIQDEYETLVAAQVARVSQQTGGGKQTGGATITDAQVITPEITAKEAQFTSINTFLDKYDALYATYTTQTNNISTFQELTNTLLSLQDQADTLYASLFNKKGTTPEMIAYNTKKQEIENSNITLIGINRLIQSIQSEINTIYPTITSNIANIDINNTDYSKKLSDLAALQKAYDDKLALQLLMEYNIYGDYKTSDIPSTNVSTLSEVSSPTSATSPLLNLSAYTDAAQGQAMLYDMTADGFTQLNNDIESLSTSKIALEDTINTIKTNLRTQNTELSSYMLVYNQRKADLAAYQASYTATQNAITTLQAQLTALEAAATQAENTIPGTTDFLNKGVELESQRKKLQEKANEIATTQSNLDSMRNDINTTYKTFFTGTTLFTNNEIVSSIIREALNAAAV